LARHCRDLADHVLGQILALNGKPYTIVGVMPRGFSFPSQAELWIPMTIPNIHFNRIV